MQYTRSGSIPINNQPQNIQPIYTINKQNYYPPQQNSVITLQSPYQTIQQSQPIYYQQQLPVQNTQQIVYISQPNQQYQVTPQYQYPAYVYGKQQLNENTDEKQICMNSSELQNFWNEMAEYYTNNLDEQGAQQALYLGFLLDCSQAKMVLEVGTGGGYHLRFMHQVKQPDCKWIATDISEKMLNVAVKRFQQYCQNQFSNANFDLQFRNFEDSFLPEGQGQQEVEFKEQNVVFKVLNCENLSCFQDNQFDAYLANLVLHLVENPQKLLNESYRVLKSKGKAGFSVWGRERKAKYYTLVGQALAENGIELPKNKRSNFHLSDKKKLIKMLEEAGFQNITAWYQFQPIEKVFEKEMKFLTETKTFSKIFYEQTEEKQHKIVESLKKNIEKEQENFNVIGIETLYITGEKI